MSLPLGRNSWLTVIIWLLVVVTASAQRPDVVPQLGHYGRVSCVCWNSDNSLFASASYDHMIMVWDARSQYLLRFFREPNEIAEIVSITFSPDGQSVISLDSKGFLYRWDLNTGIDSYQTNIEQPPDENFTFALNPTGNQISIATRSGTIVLFDVNARTIQQQLKGHHEQPIAMNFRQDGNVFASLGKDGALYVWETHTGKRLHVVNTHGTYDTTATLLRLSPDGRAVAVAGAKADAEVFDLQSGNRIASIPLGGKSVSSMNFDAASARLAIGLEDGHIIMWNVAQSHAEDRFGEDNYAVTALAFSPDGSFLVTGSDEFGRAFQQAMEASDKKGGKELKPGSAEAIVHKLGQQIDEVADKHMGDKHKMSGEATLSLWSLDGAKWRSVIGSNVSSLRTIAESPNGEFVVIGTRDTVAVVDLHTLRQRFCVNARVELQDSVRVSPDNKYVAILYWAAGAVILLDARTGAAVKLFQGMHQSGVSIAFSSDGTRLAAADHAGTIYVWDANTANLITSWKGHESVVPNLSFSFDGRYLMTAGQNDRTVKVWRTQDWALQSTFKNHLIEILSAGFHPKRALAASIGEDTLWLWNAATGQPEYHIEVNLEQKHLLYGTGLSFHPAGKEIAIASSSRILTWHWEFNEPQLLYDTGCLVSAIAYSANGSRLYAACIDGIVRVFDMGRRELLGNIVVARRPGANVEQAGILTLTPAGYYMGSRVAMQSLAYRIGKRVYPFEQFDLSRNRPDKVLNVAPDPDKNLAQAYYAAFQKRISKLGFSEKQLGFDVHLPEVKVTKRPTSLASSSETLDFAISATDTLYNLDHLYVSVNDVPSSGKIDNVTFVGSQGFALRDRSTHTFTAAVSLPLSMGRNKIQISVLNDQGVKSLDEEFVVIYTPTAPPPGPELYVMAIGVSTYQDKNHSLQYADQDADALLAFLQRHHAHYAAVHPLALKNDDANKANILRQAHDLLAHVKVDDEVILFLAGHGVLNQKLDYYFAPYDIDFSRPEEKGFSYAELEGLLDSVAARHKLLLMDTCHAGEVDKETTALIPLPVGVRAIPGVREAPTGLAFAPKVGLANSFALMQELFADLRRGSGARVITSAGGTQFAYERSGHGVFTQALLEGLEQGTTKVSELREYVQYRVRELTNGQQTPTSRYEDEDPDFDFDVY
jgi:WD40 repeat protein